MKRANRATISFLGRDFTAAKDLFTNTLENAHFQSGSSGTELYDGIFDASIVVDVAKVGIPALSALIALWLGKGKQVKLNLEEREITLKNINEQSAKEIVQLFLESQQSNLQLGVEEEE